MAQGSAACSPYADAENEIPEEALYKPPAVIPLSSSRECWDGHPASDRATLSLSMTNHLTTNLGQVKILLHCLASGAMLSTFSTSPGLTLLPLHQCPTVPIDFDCFL